MRYTVLFTFIISARLFGQAPVANLPAIIPPSPEVAQLAKTGSLSVGLHTGSANASIPIYSFNVGGVPISVFLNYNSNGIKVDDIPSRVGLGWNLIAGGQVSRVVHDEPDDDTYSFVNPPSNLTTKDSVLHNYLIMATTGDYDTEYDEYSYSFNGQSGKFFLDNEGNGTCIPHTNNQVKVYGHDSTHKRVEIITPDGVKYEFGLNYKEITKGVEIQGGSAGELISSSRIETAWFLERITTPDSQVVNLTYDTLNIYTKQGVYQTKIMPPTNALYSCDNSSPSSSIQSGTNSLNYETSYLKNISGNGISIDFTYENRPDLSRDKRLTYISIKAIDSSTAVKWFKFTYEDPSVNNSSTNKRYFLSKFSEFEIGSGGTGYSLDTGNWVTHTFEYFDLNSMPARLSYSQDWFGYNNGVTNSYFAPYLADYASGYVNGSYGANRSAGSLNEVRKGMLKKITYPTCGFDEFEYERHTLYTSTSTPTIEDESVNGSGTGSGTSQSVTYPSSTFTANGQQQATIYLSSFLHPGYQTGNEGDKIYEFRLKNITTGQVVFYRRAYYYMNESYSKTLLHNNQYQIEITVWGQANAGSAQIYYNPGSNTTFYNDSVSGVRVKLLASYDPVSRVTNRRYFTYASLANLDQSSGLGYKTIAMSAPYVTAKVCNPEDPLWIQTSTVDNIMVSSNAIAPYATFGGSTVGYHFVIESDDPDYKNGFVEHTYHTSASGSSSYTYLGVAPLSVPTDVSINYDGLEYRTRVYKRAGTSNILLKETYNNYIDRSASGIKFSTIVRRRFIWYPYTSYQPEAFSGFDLVQYHYSTGWYQMDSTVTKSYDENGSNPVIVTTKYSHDASSHILPTKIETSTSSTSSTLNFNKKVELKYPVDFSNPGAPNVYDTMVLKNIITPVIEQKSYVSNVLVSEQKNNYAKYNSNTRIFPSTVEIGLNGGAKETRLQYNSYSANGQMLEVQKTNDIKIAYIWGYRQIVPTAEVKNASATDIAFTSFENGEGMGNWAGGPVVTSSSSALAGKRSYQLSEGSITKSINSGTIYIVSYWSTSTSPLTISGTQSSQIGISSGGWTFFQHIVTGVSTVTLATTNTSIYIDEIRLYPKGAQMVTLTYEPIIGVTSNSNATGQVISYEYDNLSRLKHIKDLDQNILKKYEYAYCQSVYNCTNTAANWQSTGSYQCVKNSNNNNTGVRQELQRDMNICSATYLQTQWVSIGTNTTACPIVSNCTADYQRVVNGVCETGVRVITQTDIVDGILVCTYHYEWSDGFWSQNYQGSGVDCAE